MALLLLLLPAAPALLNSSLLSQLIRCSELATSLPPNAIKLGSLLPIKPISPGFNR
jgi:hypothetical protein